MHKRKKSIIVTSITLFFIAIVFTSIMVNAEDTDKKLCTSEARIYFFTLGVTSKIGNSETRTYSTTFDDELPDDAEVQSITATPGNMTASEFGIYISMIKSGNCPATGPSGAPICKDGIYRTNSGTETGWGGFTGVTSSNYMDYWNSHIVQPSNVDVTCNPGAKGVVECNITRTWNDSSFNGDNYTVPAKANIVIEYLSEDCADDEEDEEQACAASESGINQAQGNCGTTNYEGVKTVDFSLSRDINEGSSDYRTHRSTNPVYSDKGNGTGTSCSTTITQKLTGSANIMQNGQATITSSPASIYSGGGFKFDVNYSGRAKYELCEQINYTTSEWYASYQCPSDYRRGDTTYTYTPVGTNGRNCQLTITTETTEYDYVTRDYYTENIQLYNYQCDNHYYSNYYNRVVCENTTTSNGGTTAAEFQCRTAQTGSGTCTYSNGSLSCSGCDGQGELKTIAEKMSKYLEEPSSDSYMLTARDSNDANNSSTTEEWYEWSTSGSLPSTWYPERYVTYRVSLSQKRACIDRYTAKVRYTDSVCNEETEIDGENLYYVPLKYFGSEFKIGVSLPEISIVNLMRWSLNANCGPSCYQKIYNENGGYKFIYRPIDMSNPFPDRNEGSNWTLFMNDYNSNRNNARNKLTRNQLEYHGYLTPALISQINSYNNTKYPDLRTISTGGKSTILDDWGIVNRMSNYNKLGECSETTNGDKKCWSADQVIYGW